MVTVDAIKNLKVQELKDELKALGLTIQGNKADLAKRLEEALTSGTQQGEQEADIEPPKDEATITTTQEGVTVTAEAHAPISEEMVEEVTEAAKEAIEEEVKAEDETMIDAQKEGEQLETVEVTTTITANEDGTIETETHEKPLSAVEEPQAVSEVPAENIQEAVTEALEAANTAAEVNNESAVAITNVEETQAQDDVITQTAVATGVELAQANEGAEEGGQNGSLKVESDGVNGTQQSGAAGSVPTCRLFVGCVPYDLTEEELKAPLNEVGGLKEVSILRDAVTGKSRGCAFAVFVDKDHADQAIAKFDKQHTLPGGNQTMEVRYARETNKIQPSAEPNSLNRLFFARAPPSATEADLRAVFSEFGEVTDVAIFQNRPAMTSKGCGFISFTSQREAQAAIDNLHEKKTMTGGNATLTVKWADIDLGAKKRKAQEEANDPNRENTQIFFAKIPRTVTEEELNSVFSTVAPVKDLVIFKANQAATTNKGCGIVTLHTHAEAVEVLEKLHDTHKLEGHPDCMVLKWVDQDLQKRRKTGPGDDYGPGRHGPGGWGPGPGGPFGPGPGGFDEERPPQGCAPDAYKLFLANVPKQWETQDLRQILDGFGQVVEMNLVRDKVTKEPRGVAFAWFKTRPQADRCVRELHQKQFEHSNGSQKAISVQRAKSRRSGGYPPQGGGGFGGPRPHSPYQGQYGPPRGAPAPYQQPAPYYQQPAPAYDAYAQPQGVQQPQYNAYQAPSAYQQPATYNQASAYPAQTAYQAPAASGYNAYQAQSTPTQQSSYAPNTGYTQQYASAQQPGASAYSAPLTSTGYSTGTTGYGTQQTSYGAQQTNYTAPAAQSYGTSQTAQPAQTGYNYAQTSTTAQPNYGTAQTGTTGYNYGQQTSYTQSADGGYNYGQQTQ